MSAIRYGAEHVAGLAEEATFGTAIADDQAFEQYLTDLPDVDSDYRQIIREGANRMPFTDIKDVANHTKGHEPKITLAGPATHEGLDNLLYSWFTACTEGATTPYDKTFTVPSTPVDYTSNEGIFHTIIVKNPTASASEKITSAICQNLTIKASRTEQNGRLMYSADMVGKAYSATSNPSGTFTRTPAEYWNIFDITSFEIEGNALILDSFELVLNKTLVSTGVDGSGSFQGWASPVFSGQFNVSLIEDANARTELNRISSATRSDIEFYWGNNDGSVDEDLYFSLNGVVMPGSKMTRQDVVKIDISYKLVYDAADTSKTEPFKCIMANAIDRTW